MARYVEMIVRADDRELMAYLHGYLAGSRTTRVVLAEEAGFHVARLRERFRHHGEVQHVIIADAQANRVRNAFAKAAPRYRFEIKEERIIEQVHFEFEFDTPSEGVAKKLKALLSNLPSGARLENYERSEKTDPEARGAEIYTPEHHYHFTGRGVIRGDVFAVVDARAKLGRIDFTRAGEIIVDDG